VRAIASVGWRMVVSGGQTRLLAGESSKPTIARSPGIARPWRCAAASTPSAMSSLLAKTAVGWWRSLSSWCVAATPDSNVKSPSITSSGATSMRAAFIALAKPCSRSAEAAWSAAPRMNAMRRWPRLIRRLVISSAAWTSSMRTLGMSLRCLAGDTSTVGVPLSCSALSTCGLSHSGGVRIMPSGRSVDTMRCTCSPRSCASLSIDSTTKW